MDNFNLDNNGSDKENKKGNKKEIVKLVIALVAVMLVAVVIFAVIMAGISRKKKVQDGNLEGEVVYTEDGQAIAVGDGSKTQATGDVSAQSTFSGITSNGLLNTSNLTEFGNGYEGTKGTGDYNYGEALQKSLLFYELQRSGDLPTEVRCNWRGDSCLNDGSDAGLDLTGGWYDAGDHVKFTLPMSYTASMLGWSIIEDLDSYKESGQLEYALGNIKWANDYFIKCNPGNGKFYYQVGDGGSDHSWWGPCEVLEYRVDRPSYYVSKEQPGSCVAGGASASLAICSICYKDVDADYSKKCLENAKELYKMADEWKSDDGYTAANGFYNSWSGYYDELSWAGAWLYLATGDEEYLKKAEQYYPLANQDYNWCMCWDDVHIGAAVMLADITGKKEYTDAVEKHLDWWSKGTSDGERITYSPKGLAWLDSWGSLRYATTTSFIAAVYSEKECCNASKKNTYWDFAVSQANYALGSSGRSYLIGFGEDSPKSPHHRTAQGSYCNNMNEPSTFRHTLYGALVGGPDAGDNYTDEVSNYTTNEVACDYNAGFTGLMAKLYSKYKGQTLKDFGAVESIDYPELYIDGGINVQGDDFVEIKAYVVNESAYPARSPEKLELRYYVDLSECIVAGEDPANITVTNNYMQSGTVDGIHVWDEENNIYYLSVLFDKGSVYPGGQENYRQEIQVRMKSSVGVWDNSNDPSFEGLPTSGTAMAESMALYENDVLIFGTEPPVGEGAGKVVVPGNASKTGNGQDNTGNNQSASNQSQASGTATSEDVTLKATYSKDNPGSISGSFDITNTSDGSLNMNKLTVTYYYTKDGGSDYTFDCYHTAINGANGSYKGLSQATAKISDTECEIAWGDSSLLEQNDTVTINFAFHPSDWSKANAANDYSAESVEHIVVKYDGKVIFGEEP